MSFHSYRVVFCAPIADPTQPNQTQPNPTNRPNPLPPSPSPHGPVCFPPSQPTSLPVGPAPASASLSRARNPAARSAPSTHARASSLCHLGLARQPRHPCSVSLIARARLSVPSATSRNVRTASPLRTPAFLLGHARLDIGRPSLKCSRPLCPPPISAAPPQTRE